MRARSTDLREQWIARQIEVVLAQEDALDERRGELREREDKVSRREQDFEQRRRELESAWSRRAADLDARERALAEREAALLTRASAIEETGQRDRPPTGEALPPVGRNGDALRAERIVRAAAPEPPAAAAEAVRRAVGAGASAIGSAPRMPGGGWNLSRLQRLVEEHADANPGRLEEWRYYLHYLREFAEFGGTLPRSFDRLVWEAFGDLLGRTRGPDPDRG